ncbi:MAG: hypothetical protein M1822_001975 [Bathelium mastoideum]|nr:MAG: hypothetical protein M1822_001975 [Bathelium mastoideum]
MRKVAAITGGGLAVARVLAARPDFKVHIISNISVEDGEDVARTLPDMTFHQADVTDYKTLAATFQSLFDSSGKRLDFVFANAGVIEKTDFYATKPDDDKPPPEPNLYSVDVDLKGVILTSYLALHYFRRSPHKGNGANLIITASCGSFYPAYYAPMYAAAKHGTVGFLRSIAGHYHLNGIRANAICPGIVRTNLVGEGGWDNFPQHLFTPIAMVTKLVLLLLDGAELCDANGTIVPAEMTYGITVEINQSNYYVRSPIEFCDDAMRDIMEATTVENQKGGVIKD